MIPRTLKNFTLFLDGQPLSGRVEEIELPKIKNKTEEHRAGGMDVPITIDMGMEKLEAKFTLAEYDPAQLRLFGQSENGDVPMVARGAIQRGNEAAVAVIVTMRGRFTEIDMGNWKAGDKTKLTLMVNPNYYKLQIGGVTIYEIDPENMVRAIGGFDQLDSQRIALGM